MRTLREMIKDGEPDKVLAAKITTIAEAICDGYCRYTAGPGESDATDAICEECPLNWL